MNQYIVNSFGSLQIQFLLTIPETKRTYPKSTFPYPFMKS